MNKKIISVAFAVIFCFIAVTLNCFAAVTSEEKSSVSDIANRGIVLRDSSDLPFVVENEILKCTAQMNEDLTRLNLTISFAGTRTDYAHTLLGFKITFRQDMLSSCIGISGTLMGKAISSLGDEVVSYSPGNYVEINLPSDGTNRYAFTGSLSLVFSVNAMAAQGAKSDIMIAGTANVLDDEKNPTAKLIDINGTVVFAKCSHNNTSTWVETEATCDHEGSRVTYCSDCQMVVRTDIIKTLEHTLSSKPTRVIKSATCTISGLGEYVCSVCHSAVKKQIPATGHEYGTPYEVSGVWYEKCVNCDYVQRSSKTCSHDLTNYQVESYISMPTCTTSGIGILKCKICGATMEQKIDAYGHDFVDVEVIRQPTLTETGLKKVKCKLCQIEDQVIIPIHSTHTYAGKEEVIAAPTCTSTGTKKVYCSFSGCTSYIEVVVPAAGHTFSEWVIDVDPTCVQEGSTSRVCQVCEYIEKKTISKLPSHTYSDIDWQVMREPTCTVPGEKQRKCIYCDNIQTEAIPVSEHTYTDNYEIVDASTCITTGLERRLCTVCGGAPQVRTVPVVPDAHIWDEWKIDTEADCINDGQKSRVCKNCQKVETEVIKAEGHKYGIDTSDKKNVSIKTCTVCGSLETVTTTKKGVTKTVKNGIITVSFANTAAASEDIFFVIGKMSDADYDNKVEPFVSQFAEKGLGKIESAYTYKLNIGSISGTLGDATSVEIELGEEYKKTGIDVWYFKEDASIKKLDSEYVTRKGTKLLIDTANGAFADSDVSFMLVSNGTAAGTDYTAPITIAILTVVIAVGVVFFIMSKGNGKGHRIA